MWRISWLIFAAVHGDRIHDELTVTSLRDEGRLLMHAVPFQHLGNTLSEVQSSDGVFRVISTSMLPSKQYNYRRNPKPRVSLLFNASACEILVATWDMNDLMMGGAMQGNKPLPWEGEVNATAWWSIAYPKAYSRAVDKGVAGDLDLSADGWQPEWKQQILQVQKTGEQVRANLHSSLSGADVRELDVNEVMVNCPFGGLLGVGLSRDDEKESKQVQASLAGVDDPSLKIMMVEMCATDVAWDVDNPDVKCR